MAKRMGMSREATGDLNQARAIQALCQLSYSPKIAELQAVCNCLAAAF